MLKKLMGLAGLMTLTTTGIALTAPVAFAQRGGIVHRGTVSMKGASAHSSKAKGDGKVNLHGAYYVAPSVDCSLTVSGMDMFGIADGSVIYVTLEYLNPLLPPLLVGAITISGGSGSFANVSVVNIDTRSTITTMSVRDGTGAVLMFGQVKGLP